MGSTSGKFLLEMLLDKELPLALLYVEAGLLVFVIPPIIMAILAGAGFNTFVWMWAGFLLLGIGIYFYAPIFVARGIVS